MFRPLIYVQISPERVSIRNLKTGASITQVPEIAIRGARDDPKARIVAIGALARVAATADSRVSVFNPFAYPRWGMADFPLAGQLLKGLLHPLQEGFLRIAPRMVVHPLGVPEDGLTPREQQAFRQLAVEAGASSAVLWQGRELSDEELRQGRFELDA